MDQSVNITNTHLPEGPASSGQPVSAEEEETQSEKYKS